ncbi:hypothetical protein KDL29_07100 [bacterium]|nr:hypothetical protein [bacterium]
MPSGELDPAGLADLPRPEVLDAPLWQELQLELARQLSARYPAGQRATAAVPDGEKAAAQLDYDESTQTLSWYYANPGVYDQNGLVGIADLTPLGVNFGASEVPNLQPGMIGLLADSL